MKKFMEQDFMLDGETARHLYYGHAAKMPIIDYHCHINPQQIAENYRFRNITDAWLSGDHYKWRLIRSNGVDEDEITGDKSSDYTKFQHFAAMLPRALGNPMYHWTHLELQRYFGITKPLNPDTCKEIWEQCNEKLASDDFTVPAIIRRSQVKLICTTDDPADDLRWHKMLAANPDAPCRVLPAWSPDKAMKPEKPGFADYVRQIGTLTGTTIKTCKDFFAALDERMRFFNEMGCRAADHGIDYVLCSPCDEAALEQIFKRALSGASLSQAEIDTYKTMILCHLAGGYTKYDWVMQMHFGAIRDPNEAMFKRLGADTGFDYMGDQSCAIAIGRLMNLFSTRECLPKMIWYSLNPADNPVICTAIGAFQGPGVRGRIQQGAAWWFNDSFTGMVDQMTSFANLSVLGNFLGMLTDSRSFLSYTRHEYFRRILCNFVGRYVDEGMYPEDLHFLGQMIEDICFNNTNRYFGFDVR